MNKDSSYNFTFLSFSSNQTVLIEPAKATWDLVFTQYTHIFYGPTVTPYLVTGCLLNRYRTQAKMDSTIHFSQITLKQAYKYSLSPNITTIGYDWKAYTGGTYISNAKMSYIIKDSEGIFYKLHFIDFYNASGVKGNPKWEYQEL